MKAEQFLSNIHIHVFSNMKRRGGIDSGDKENQVKPKSILHEGSRGNIEGRENQIKRKSLEPLEGTIS